MDQDQAAPEVGSARDRAPGVDRGRLGSGQGNARVAAAAQAAVDGLEGVQRRARRSGQAAPRSPGIGVLFGPAEETSSQPTDAKPVEFAPAPAATAVAPTREPTTDAPPREPTTDAVTREPTTDAPTREPTTDAAVAEAAAERPSSDAAPATVDSGVWNPFRQQPPTDPTHLGVRPRIRHVHTRRHATEATVIATLELGGRLAHGTAVGPPVMHGVLRAVAEATVAALRIVCHAPLQVGVEHVTLATDDEPPTVSVVATWVTGFGEETLVGMALVEGDLERAVVQATLDALGRRLDPLLERARDPSATSGS